MESLHHAKSKHVSFLGIFLFAGCEGPYAEFEPAEEHLFQEDHFDPDLVDMFSLDTNWYIDDVGNIVLKY